MGQVYSVPNIGVLNYTATTAWVTSLNSQQSAAASVLRNQGLKIFKSTTYQTTGGNSYCPDQYLGANVDGELRVYYNSNGNIYSYTYKPAMSYKLYYYYYDDRVGNNKYFISYVDVQGTGEIADPIVYDYTLNCTDLNYYSTSQEAYDALYAYVFPSTTYPITYHYINSTVSGPSEAAVGDTVIVSAVPDVGYGITDASSQILVTNNDVAVPYTWDSANNRITFTMPDPS